MGFLIHVVRFGGGCCIYNYLVSNINHSFNKRNFVMNDNNLKMIDKGVD